ncbi:MAG: hypothetical protein HYZ13_11335 [Acidobacteria bacterium]|nr:hypothetical protein [Acidobacteriota bacterium]
MKRILPILAMVAPLAAQTFGDAPAFGGSKAFSDGLAAKGNPARYDQAQPGWYLSWEMGDDKAKGFKDASDRTLKGFATSDSALTLAGLQELSKAPYAERSRTYGLAVTAQGGIYFSLGREQLTASRVVADLATPAASTTQVGYALIDRLIMGVGSGVEGQAYGFAFRVERIRSGRADQLLTGTASADASLDYRSTTRSNVTATLDLGSQFQLAPNLRMAITGDRLIPRTINGVEEKAQFHAGIALDLSPAYSLIVETDINKAQRLPLPVDQRTAGASLRMAFGPGLSVKVGARRKTVDGLATTLLGASLTLRNAPLHVTVGFQFGDDRAQKAFAAKVDG